MTQVTTERRASPLSAEMLDSWITSKDFVGLHLRQKLLPVEGEGGIIFPPTYADIGYNIDTLSDGRRVATIDSVGSQANRIEPAFKRAHEHEPPNPLADLVPQIEILLQGKKAMTGLERRSIFELAHRGADAVVLASPTLAPDVAEAFNALRSTGDAAPLCALVPTSLVFGVWDSRGGSGEKRPRIVHAVIRAWDVDVLHAAAQFNSVWKVLAEDQQQALEQEAKSRKVKLSTKGFADAPATFRKLGDKAARAIPEFRDGAPNPERRVLGGIVSRGPIERDVRVNLVALRGLRGNSAKDTTQIRRYVLGLSLLAATTDIELFLREGCLLRYAGEEVWSQVPTRGAVSEVDLMSARARETILSYTRAATDHFRPSWPKTLQHEFNLNEAKKLLAKKDDVDSAVGDEG